MIRVIQFSTVFYVSPLSRLGPGIPRIRPDGYPGSLAGSSLWNGFIPVLFPRWKVIIKRWNASLWPFQGPLRPPNRLDWKGTAMGIPMITRESESVRISGGRKDPKASPVIIHRNIMNGICFFRNSNSLRFAPGGGTLILEDLQFHWPMVQESGMDILSPGLVSLLLPSLRRRSEKNSRFPKIIAWPSPIGQRFNVRLGAVPETIREQGCTGREAP
jgi:hypothetical protein